LTFSTFSLSLLLLLLLFFFFSLSLFLPILGRPRLILFTLQLNQVIFSHLSLSDHRSSKPVNQDIQLQRCGTKSQHFGTCVCTQTEPLDSPLKSEHFLSEVGQQSFERLTHPVLLFIQQIITFISFSSKTVLTESCKV
jgi:hypothetical protein